MHKRGLLPLILLMMMNLFAQAQGVKQLDPQNFEIKYKEAKQPILLDVRTQGEYAQGHLPNAIVIDIYSNEFKSNVNKLDKSKPVFVYCKAGSRSSSAVEILTEVGFKEIYDLNGGFMAWTKANMLVEKK